MRDPDDKIIWEALLKQAEANREQAEADREQAVGNHAIANAIRSQIQRMVCKHDLRPWNLIGSSRDTLLIATLRA